jgi:hypothetical protein
VSGIDIDLGICNTGVFERMETAEVALRMHVISVMLYDAI